MVAAALVTFALAEGPPAASAGAFTTTTTITHVNQTPGAPTCGVVVSTSVRVLAVATPCVVATTAGSAFRIVFGTGYRWIISQVDTTLIRVGGVTMLAGGGLSATIHARQAGQTLVMAVGRVSCQASKPCAALALLWSLRIVISPKHAPLLSAFVTQANGGRTYTLHRGQALIVQLTGPTIYRWSEPMSSRSTVLRRTSGTSGHPATGNFVAAGLGRATVTAVGTPSCYPQCLMPSRLFSITVLVSG